MESYQTWFREGPEVSVLRMLGLFDRPADEKVLGALLKPPPIPGLTEPLTDLSPIELRTIVAKLRRARLLAGDDPHNPGQLDTHPLVREYFGGHTLQSGRFRVRATTRDVWSSDLALGSRTVSGRRGQHAWRYLSGLFGFNRLAFRRDRLLPSDYRGSHFSCE